MRNVGGEREAPIVLAKRRTACLFPKSAAMSGGFAAETACP
jgi:hypothetical protein